MLSACLALATISFVPLPTQDPQPDPLTMRDGARVSSAADWPQRRAEIRALFDEHVYGRMPARSAELSFEVIERDAEALDGRATRKQVRLTLRVDARQTEVDLLLYVPNDRDASAPAFLGLNFYGNHSVIGDPAIGLSRRWLPKRAAGVIDHRATEAARGTATERWQIAATVARGWAVVTLYHGDLTPDRDDFADGVHPLFAGDGPPRPRDDEWGALAMWAWGLHRALDYLETDPDIDARRVAVVGHSRNGKTALLAGATDERFALVISNQSGCGGAALSRRGVGETVEKINDRFPHWFAANFRAFNDREADLPVDQHLLIALIAPRPVLVCSAVGDAWADPQGEFLALRGADAVYRLLGTDGLAVTHRPPPGLLVRSTLGYHIREGKHGVGEADWQVFAEFATRHLRR